MAKSKRIRWTDVYQCQISVQAKLITSVLHANGLQAKIQTKKDKKSKISVPFVRVNKNQAQQAKELMLNYNLSL